MTLNGKLWTGVLSLATLTIIGTVGYMLIEGATVVDAIYMVLITITTVGFGEIFQLSAFGRLWTIAVMISGVGIALYTIGAGFERLLDLSVNRHKQRTQALISDFEDHVILCGYGRVGKGVAESLRDRGQRLVVIEATAEGHQRAEDAGFAAILGDATMNSTLEAAGIHHAKSLVACVTDDSDNLVIILSARSLSPTLHLVSRASDHESEPKLRLAGADRIVAPQVVGSERLAAMAVERQLADVFDVFVGGRALEFSVEELWVDERSAVVGTSIKESAIRERSGALVLAVEDSKGTTLQTPTPDYVLKPNSTVVVVGSSAQVAAAARLFAPA